MESSAKEIGLLSIIWIILFAISMIVTLRRHNTVGLTATFLMTFLANHWLGSVLYVLPWQTLYPPHIVDFGLKQSVWGIAAFTVGSVIMTPRVIRESRDVIFEPQSLIQTQQELPKRIVTYLLVGVLFFFLPLIVPFLRQLPTFGTFITIPSKFTILAVYLFIHWKIQLNSKQTWLYVLFIAGFFPLVGVIFTGFASYGSIVSILLIMFYFAYNRISFSKIVFLLLVAYIGLTGLIIYLQDRTTIRANVWGGQPLATRFSVLMDTASTFEWFSLNNPKHLYQIDNRLNRNFYVGAAVRNVNAGFVDYAMGQTFLDALIAPIPRVLWPGKPVISGDNFVFSKYTGIIFARSNAAGMGPLFEGYINFGTIGVVGLFLFYGVFLGFLDAQARRALDKGQYLSFAIWTLPVVELLNGVEPTGSLVAPAIFTYIVLKMWQHFFERTEPKQTQMGSQKTHSLVQGDSSADPTAALFSR